MLEDDELDSSLVAELELALEELSGS